MQIQIYYAEQDEKVISHAKKQAGKAGISMSRLVLNALQAISINKPAPAVRLPSAER